MIMKLPELLAPAGNMERLKTALLYGADAVYIGSVTMSLRNFAANFTAAEMAEACAFAHDRNKKVYVAVNAFARDEDLENIGGLFDDIKNAGADALIINDPGVIRLAKKMVPDMPLHLSTQANTLNSSAAAFWHDQGISRVILARELTYEQIVRLRERTPKALELEMFVHGSMCVSYSGRCLLSNYIAGRDCYKGECAQPCRWTYEIREKGSDDAYYPIEQDETGTYLLNSRDLNLIEHIPGLIQAGIASLKIEGRMKSVSYIATVVNAYRMALDEYKQSIEKGMEYCLNENIIGELDKASHRPYSTGFLFDEKASEAMAPSSGAYIKDRDIAAVVLECDDQYEVLLEQRNKFYDGDELDLLTPGCTGEKIIVRSLRNEEKEPISSAPHPKQHVYFKSVRKLKPGDILRKSL
jgi:putative protease